MVHAFVGWELALLALLVSRRQPQPLALDPGSQDPTAKPQACSPVLQATPTLYPIWPESHL